MDNHEPYFDDENGHHDDFPSSFSSEDPPERSSSRMKPMSVSTGDFDSASSYSNSSSTGRKALIASITAVVFLIIGLLITEGSGRSKDGFVIPDGTDPGHQTGFGGSGSGSGSHSADISAACSKYDAQYFNDLLWNYENMNATDPALCVDAVHSCKCFHPMRPLKQAQHPGWLMVVKMNIDLMETNYSRFPPDLVVYGDSIVEHMIGRNYGHYLKDYAGSAVVTQQLLTKRGGGLLNALPMGIAADHIAHLLYRIRTGGEMPESLHPKAFWILIGTNDLGMGCAIDTVVAGNIHIVKEIRERHNNQHGHKTLTPVVMNSLLPRGRQELLQANSPWSSIRQVNEQLECYAELTEGVHFVNVTDTFATTNATGTFLNETLMMNDHLHPTTEGNRQWEESIVSNFMQLMT